MSGPIGLHGGGEYVAGDEQFLDALLDVASEVARRRASRLDVGGHALASDSEAGVATLRIVILPTAAGRGRPDRAAATGQAAFIRRAAVTGTPATVEIARVVDAASAADPANVERIARADLIHLPGGDPDLIPATLGGSRSFDALRDAWERGAVVAGASAGAMAFAEWTWTQDGGIPGLGFLHGLAVVPHYDDARRRSWQQTFDELSPGGIGFLGLDERTGVISVPNGSSAHDWRVAGEGAVYWFARSESEPLIGRHGDVLHLPI